MDAPDGGPYADPGLNYIAWRWASSLNRDAWWIAGPLVAAETYSLIDVALFGMTAWRLKKRKAAPAPRMRRLKCSSLLTLDMVMDTALAGQGIRHPRSTWILDHGNRPELRQPAEQRGLGYGTRGRDWDNMPRHAKAGNLNNALMVTGCRSTILRMASPGK